MRISRIVSHDALYYASVSAQTFEAIGETIIISPIDFGEIVNVNLTKSTGDIKHNHIQGIDEFMLKFAINVYRSDFLQEIKRSANRNAFGSTEFTASAKKRSGN